MAVSAASERLERVERFLDMVDNVKSPGDLQEPFKSLWLRIHGEKPTMMSEERKEALISGGLKGGIFEDVQISSGPSPKNVKGSIEVISPKQVGPTVEMEVEKEEKVTFKMAKGDDLKNIEHKEGAANEMITLQGSVKNLSGLGGEVAKVWEGIRDVAQDYRDGNYIKALELGKSLGNFLGTEKFKRSVMSELQNKLAEYKELGGDTTKAKERFKDLASSFKEDRSDFIQIAGEINTLAEDSIKGIVEEEIVAEVKALPKKEEPVKEKKSEPKRTIRKKPVQQLPKEIKKSIPEEGEKEPEPEEDIKEEEKPVIKIVTVKKLVPVQKVMKQRMEMRQEMEDKTKEDGSSGDVMELDETEIVSEEKEIIEEKAHKTKGKMQEGAEKQNAPSKEKDTNEEVSDKVPEKQGPSPEDIQSAFKKYQFVYNASIKLNEKGKDMSQIFDLMHFAEQVRQKGDMKTYIGVCDQMENMLIKSQG